MKKTTFGTKRNQKDSLPFFSNKSTLSRRTRTSSYKNVHKFSFLSIFTNLFTRGHISLGRIFGGFIIIFIIGALSIWGFFLRDLPNIRQIENPEFFRESTVFYDAEDKEFYRFSERGKRTYVTHERISQSIKDAIVATEDSGFWENPGIDFFGLFRAGFNYITGKSGAVKGTSTLSQQLIKNTLLTNERSLKRKIQEAYLAYQLNQTYSKEKILEMYLNAIEFGHGANGIEQASLTFFGKSASDVGKLGATILASLPKGPSLYSPYSNRGNLMGKIEAYPTDSPKNRILLSLETANNQPYAPLYSTFKEYIKNLSYVRESDASIKICGLKKEYSGDSRYQPNNAGCITTNYADILNIIGGIKVTGNITINGTSENYTIEYTIGRKDYVAVAMLKENKITGEDLGKIIFDGLEFQFNKPQKNMKYPYFVMYVKEQLEKKYGKDLNITEGLKVYTTINPKLQEKAEEIIYRQVHGDEGKKNGNKNIHNASSAALISMNNVTGEIVAMVGGPDYFDEKNGGNNNMTTAKRQPGSSFKPFLYALAVSKQPIGPESPVTDAQTKFGTYEPNNYDKKFLGIMSLGKALGYSRNIPAVKMYFLANREKEIVDFAQKLGITTLNHNGDYGAAISLGAGEVRAIDMMQAYSVFANNGIKKEAFAIRRIEDSQGGIIEEQKESAGQEVFSPAASHIINTILSKNEYRPESDYWRNNLTISGKTVAAKTGTANKPAKKGTNLILPGDTWTIGYSPNYTTVVWAGNVDGSALKGGCDGINCAAPAWKNFMTYALKDLPNTDWKAPEGIKTYKTNKLTGLISENGITNIMAVELKEKDGGNKEIKIDEYCGKPATNTTPEDAIITLSVPSGKPIIDGYDPEWLKSYYADLNIATLGKEVVNKNGDCTRPHQAGNMNIENKFTGIGNNILEISWNGDRMIQKIQIISDNTIIEEKVLEDAIKQSSYRINTNRLGEGDIIIRLIDTYGYRYSKSLKSNNQPELTPPSLPSIIEEARNKEPTINISNPARSQISIYSGDMFNLRFQAETGTEKKNITITIDGKVLESATTGDIFKIPVPSEGLSIGDHTVEINLTDGNNKTTSKKITLTILER